MKTVFVAWQDPSSRRWYPIGRLTANGSRYWFTYTESAREAQRECAFSPLPAFPDLEAVYESDTLFPLFSNRILSPSRPDYPDYVQWLNVPRDENDPIVLLARSGGRRMTDSLEMFPQPEPDDQGKYHIHFFAHGVRHLPEPCLERIKQLRSGEALLLALDFQNPHDPRALMLRTNDAFPRDRYIVGYCPRYLLPDAFEVLQKGRVEVAVERVNLPPAPVQMRLLCGMTGQWPADFQPFSDPAYEPIPTHAGT